MGVGPWAGVTASAGDMTIEYNGVKFGGTDSNYHLYWPRYGITATTQYDAAGIQSIGVMYDVILESVLMPNPTHVANNFQGNTEADLDYVRYDITRRLAEPNGILKIGFGPGAAGQLVGNPLYGTSTQVDSHISLYGVKPRTLEIVPYNAVFGAMTIKWRFTAFFDFCQDSTRQASSRAWAELYHAWTFSTTWNIAANGRQSRVIVGDAFRSSYAFQQGPPLGPGFGGADALRENFANILPPNNFKRVSQVYIESPDKTAERVVLVDQEFEGSIYPRHMVHAGGTQTLHTHGVGQRGDGFAGFAQGVFAVDASFEVAPTMEPFYGVAYAWAYLASQFDWLQIRYGSLKAKDDPNYRANVFTTSLAITRGLWDDDRRISLRATFQISGKVVYGFEDRALWGHPTVMPQWLEWHNTVPASYRPRGYAGLKTFSYERAFRCGTTGNGVLYIDERTVPLGVGTSPVLLGACNCNQWLQYRTKLYVWTDTGVKVIPRAASDNYPPVHSDDDVPPTNDDGIPTGLPPSASEPPIGEDFIFDQDSYYASSVRHDIAGVWCGDIANLRVHAIKTVNGKIAHPVGDEVSEYEQIGSIYNCPIYLLRYARMYSVNGRITKIKTAPAPLSGYDPPPELDAEDGHH